MREQDINVLIPGAGGAAGINTIKSLRLSNFKGKIIGIDSASYSAGFYLSDAHCVVPKASDARYRAVLLALVQKININVILPTSGFDIVPISKAQKKLEKKGVVVYMSDQPTIDVCTDKRKTYKKLRNIVPLPTTYQKPEDIASFPIFLKPAIGKGSVNSYVCSNQKSVLAYKTFFRKPFIMQEYLPGTEYTVDVLFDTNGAMITAVVRERIRTDSGISTVGKVVAYPEIVKKATRACKALKVKGPATVQFKKNTKGEPVFIEINPRLGGGTIISTLSGVNIPRLIVDGITGNKLNITPPKSIRVTRYLEEILI